MTVLAEFDPFLVIWIAITAMSLFAIAAVLIWAVQAKQFRGQKRARRLALRSGIPEDSEPQKQEQPPKKAEGPSHDAS